MEWRWNKEQWMLHDFFSQKKTRQLTLRTIGCYFFKKFLKASWLYTKERVETNSWLQTLFASQIVEWYPTPCLFCDTFCRAAE